MKKSILLCMFSILIIVGFFLIFDSGKKVSLQLDENHNIFLLVDTESEPQKILPWLDDSNGTYYFFLPAFSHANKLQISDIADTTVFWNGTLLHNGLSLTYNDNEIVSVDILDNNDSTITYNVCILRSENLPSVFIDTASGNMKSIHKDKEYYEEGNISIIKADGNTEYNGSLERISGRGNSTWGYDKRPYSIKLSEKKALLGMDAGKKWSLLAGWREGSKLATKIAYDMAEEIGLAYSPQCEWIDLYLNGEYVGIYYLSEAVTIADGRIEITDLDELNVLNNPAIKTSDVYESENIRGYVIENPSDITGGYLIEKDYPSYWQESDSRFMTSSGHTFSIKEPQQASVEQVQYIYNCVQKIDDMIAEGNPDYQNYIDLKSFAKKFVIDEIAVNQDISVTSMYFYKEKGDDKLYAGPVWDFDNSFGEQNSTSTMGEWVDYTISIVDSPRPSKQEILPWYTFLYEDPTFKNAMLEEYNRLLPFIDLLLDVRIDAYASWINKSVYMDEIRYHNKNVQGDKPGHYSAFANDVQYMKYYIANRVNYLNERWNIPYEELSVENKNEQHTVTFMVFGECIETRLIQDGETINNLPALYESDTEWYYEHSGERYNEKIPVYEDVVLYWGGS